MPAVVLPPDVPEDADHLEADAAVQADARVVRHGNAGKRAAVALRDKIVEQTPVERASDALPVKPRVEIRGHFDREPVRRALAVRRAVRIAGDAAVALGDQVLPLAQA